ncbi:putative pentatricopeptide repeat-containing protein-like [Capsicum annuum]|nr:putative pentatricopeptide repeat-containing protein-like [Capsicum annuum]
MEEKDELEEKEYVDDNEDELKNNNLAMQNTSSWFSKMISLQAEIMTTILISLVSPIFYILSFANSEYYNLLPPEQETEKKVTVAVNAVATVPSKLVDGGTLLLKKFGVGILGAAYVCMILTTLLIVSGILGFGFVRMWMEEPVVLREELYFDYADVHPKAVFSFGGRMEGYNRNDHRSIGVPVGHTIIIIKRGAGNGKVKSSMYVAIQKPANPANARIYDECALSTWTYSRNAEDYRSNVKAHGKSSKDRSNQNNYDASSWNFGPASTLSVRDHIAIAASLV